MFSSIRRHLRLSPAGVVAVIALVFAMVGGAFAANNQGSGATASAKAKRGPKGPKGATGPAGPAGAQGPAGPAGAKGDAGAAGGAGTAGATGATGPAGPKGAAGAAGAAGEEGPEGSPWTLGGKLPSGKSETGGWSFASEEFISVPLASFTLPLMSQPTPHFIPPGGPENQNDEEACPGTAPEPIAEPGNFCVYASLMEGATFVGSWFAPELGEEGTGVVGKFGAIGVFSAGAGRGDWIVTAP